MLESLHPHDKAKLRPGRASSHHRTHPVNKKSITSPLPPSRCVPTDPQSLFTFTFIHLLASARVLQCAPHRRPLVLFWLTLPTRLSTHLVDPPLPSPSPHLPRPALLSRRVYQFCLDQDPSSAPCAFTFTFTFNVCRTDRCRCSRLRRIHLHLSPPIFHLFVVFLSMYERPTQTI